MKEQKQNNFLAGQNKIYDIKQLGPNKSKWAMKKKKFITWNPWNGKNFQHKQTRIICMTIDTAILAFFACCYSVSLSCYWSRSQSRSWSWSIFLFLSHNDNKKTAPCPHLSYLMTSKICCWALILTAVTYRYLWHVTADMVTRSLFDQCYDDSFQFSFETKHLKYWELQIRCYTAIRRCAMSRKYPYTVLHDPLLGGV